MKKMKTNKTNRTVAMSAIAIGVVSALFIGVNSLVFATESNKTETITPDPNTAEIAAPEDTSPAGYQASALTVSELESAFSDSDRKGSALSAEDAALIGAEHIWEIFGETIDGKIVEMFYEESIFTSRTYWTGYVGNTQADMDTGSHIFIFEVDAVSGEKKGVLNCREPIFQAAEDKAKEPYLDNPEKCIEISIEFDRKRKENARELYQAAPEEYENIAREAAQKHLKASGIANLTYLEDRSGIVFIVTDDTGHKIEVSISPDTKQVEFIDDQLDEIDPAFVPDPNAVG